MTNYNTSQRVGSNTGSKQAASSDHNRQNRFDRTWAVPASQPRRNWSVSPPRCPEEEPRPYAYTGCYDHSDVSPLASPITPYAKGHKNTPADNVGEKEVLFANSVTDKTACNISPVNTPKSPYIRPDELFLPEAGASEVNRTFDRRNVVALLNRGANVGRAASAFDQSMLRRQNAIRERSVTLRSQQLQPKRVPETDTVEFRLGLVGNNRT